MSKLIKLNDKTKEVLIWQGFKYRLNEGQSVEELLDIIDDGGITYMGTGIRKITDLEGKTLTERKGDFKY